MELAHAGVPTVVAYRGNAISAAIVRRLVTVRFVSLVNLLVDREVEPEYLQENCTPEKLAAAADKLLSDPALQAAQRAGFREAVGRLAVPRRPSEIAAEVVLRVAAVARRTMHQRRAGAAQV